jgi:hypothetical protein
MKSLRGLRVAGGGCTDPHTPLPSHPVCRGDRSHRPRGMSVPGNSPSCQHDQFLVRGTARLERTEGRGLTPRGCSSGRSHAGGRHGPNRRAPRLRSRQSRKQAPHRDGRSAARPCDQRVASCKRISSLRFCPPLPIGEGRRCYFGCHVVSRIGVGLPPEQGLCSCGQLEMTTMTSFSQRRST